MDIYLKYFICGRIFNVYYILITLFVQWVVVSRLRLTHSDCLVTSSADSLKRPHTKETVYSPLIQSVLFQWVLKFGSSPFAFVSFMRHLSRRLKCSFEGKTKQKNVRLRVKELQWDSLTVVLAWMGVVLGLLNRCDESNEYFLLYLCTCTLTYWIYCLYLRYSSNENV